MRFSIYLPVLIFSVAVALTTHGESPDHKIPITGTSIQELASLDEAILKLIVKHDLPGISLAISDHGRIIHSRGYGYADRETGAPVVSSSRFRIASISKPITAVAILRLVELGKLRLEDRIVEVLDTPEPIAGASTPDPRLNDVTILHLLQHRGGWDRDKSFDPMFRSVQWAKLCGCDPPAMPNEVIRAMHSQPLDFDPGNRYAYSNYGYCLLGRAIEKISGQKYEDFVQDQIFQPLEIKTITLGKTRLENRQPDEVRYYHHEEGKSVFANDLDSTVPAPYGSWCLEAMDAHGGWIATADDLVRFINALPFGEQADSTAGPARTALTAASAQMILTIPNGESTEKDSYYGLGWTIRPSKDGSHTVWHTGSLPGTATELTRRPDGRCFAVLINSRSGAGGKNPLNEVTTAVHRALADLRTDLSASRSDQ